ncbi:hypothetical protein AVEN_179088-1 [Araneus ventricosus]|uniref:Peptidase A2 domain-containing protein n=1 Tax=Araneus ventricosus TaxID=182803 RepID=A0A4Y2V1U7_ARAVE|nr:hypothetical protein AVEN_102186-1 [Araneus ventricosus]GBO19202.1 hypothetical protein AVEN_179088-1 [Araneus ventricosus]
MSEIEEFEEKYLEAMGKLQTRLENVNMPMQMNNADNSMSVNNIFKDEIAFLFLSHKVAVYDSSVLCYFWRGRHHSSIHDSEFQKESVSDFRVDRNTKVLSNLTAIEKPTQESPTFSVNTSSPAAVKFYTLPPTAKVKIANQSGQEVSPRVLLDSGAAGSFIIERCTNEMRSQKRKISYLRIGEHESWFN